MYGVRSQNRIHITSLCECGIREKEHAGKCDMLSFHGGCRNVKKYIEILLSLRRWNQKFANAEP